MKIKIPIPDTKPHYKTKITIQVGDLNYGDHLGNDRLLLLAHEVRMKYFHSLNQSEASFFGRGLIMTDSAVQYLAQGKWNDQIVAKVWLAHNSDTRFDLFYELELVHKESEEKIKTLAKIKTGLAFFDYEVQRVAKATQEFKNYLTGIASV